MNNRGTTGRASKSANRPVRQREKSENGAANAKIFPPGDMPDVMPAAQFHTTL
jgi:hypothetical protein